MAILSALRLIIDVLGAHSEQIKALQKRFYANAICKNDVKRSLKVAIVDGFLKKNARCLAVSPMLWNELFGSLARNMYKNYYFFPDFHFLMLFLGM